MTPETRAELLRGLADVVVRHAEDRATGGLEAFRLMRTVGASWLELLGPVHPDAWHARCCLLLFEYGNEHAVDARDYGRLMLKLMHVATPADLALAAVLTSADPPTPDATSQMLALLKRLVREDVAQRTATNSLAGAP